MLNHAARYFSYRQLCAFFIPLAFSSSLTAITHVIINGTLSRGENAAFIISCYAVAFALFGLVERPIIVFRQTSSALVKDAQSFKLLTVIFIYVLAVILLISSVIGYSFIGDWVFVHLFNADGDMVTTVSRTFQVITIVIIFSGIRAIYQGVIINHLETKWLTIGVIIRLSAMFIVASLFVLTGNISSIAGAVIFLTGMLVECVISVWKGHRLLNKFEKEHSRLTKLEIFQFYTPLVFYFFIQSIVVPVVYVFLAKTEQIQLGIASFALAYSISQLLLSFFMYTHQIVLQFHANQKKKLIKFMIVISIIPSSLLSLLCFTPAGFWFMQEVMGADMMLAEATLDVLKFFILKAVVFPWVDFLNGFLMLDRSTKRMLAAQVINILTVITSLFVLVYYFPELNGMNGAIAASLGELAGLGALLGMLYQMRNNQIKKEPSFVN